MKVRKRVCIFTGDWEEFEIIEFEYDTETKPLQKKEAKVKNGHRGSTDATKSTEFAENEAILSKLRSRRDLTDTMCLKRRASLFFIVSLFAFATVLFLGISLGTEYWIHAELQRDLSAVNSTDPKLPLKGYIGSNPIDESDPGAFLGIVRFGLLSGCKRFNYGLGIRDPKCFTVFKEHKDVYNINITIAVIVFILCAIAFGLVATVFGLVNTLTVPIETIHGPTGLYIWNAIGAFFSFIAWILYLILYHNELKYNVLNEIDIDSPNFFHTDKVRFGYSYWLLIAGFCLFLLNIFFVFLAQCVQDPQFLWRKKKENEFESGNKNDVGLGLMY